MSTVLMRFSVWHSYLALREVVICRFDDIAVELAHSGLFDGDILSSTISGVRFVNSMA